MSAKDEQDDLRSALDRLGREVRDRRKELDLSQEALGEQGGPSTTTLSGIELGKIDAWPSSATVRKLERGLRWMTGSVDAIRQGERPTPLGPVALPIGPRTMHQMRDTSVAWVDVLWDQYSHMEERIQALRAQLDDARGAMERARTEVDELGRKLALAESEQSGVMERLRFLTQDLTRLEDQRRLPPAAFIREVDLTFAADDQAEESEGERLRREQDGDAEGPQ